MTVIWRTPEGAEHHQVPGQDCGTCNVRHLVTQAAETEICMGDAHTWTAPQVCVFCSKRWTVKAGAGP